MTEVNFEVDRTNLAETRFTDITDLESLSINSGQVVLNVDHFALTANNITYGVAGDMIGYWKFFPAEDNWGRIPVWGIGTVTVSKVEGISPGDRFYGYYPMSSYLIVEPTRVSERGFVDNSSHRQELPPTYNQYSLMNEDNGFNPEHDRQQMIYKPLFATAFVLDDFFADNDFFGANKIILSSASSKTSFSLAFLLHKNRDVKVVGLTSKGNMDFVANLGIYDEVVSYDDIDSMDNSAAVAFIDMAGNRKVLENLHHHFADNMKYSCGVGITHWDAMAGATSEPLPGAAPQMFFAPTQMQKRNQDWGPEKYQALLAEQWAAFMETVNNWVTIEEVNGQEGLNNTYHQVLNGAAPNRAYVLSL